jgi:hypothetical protein
MIPWIVNVRFSYDALPDYKTQMPIPSEGGLTPLRDYYYHPIVVSGSRSFVCFFGSAIPVGDPLIVHAERKSR